MKSESSDERWSMGDVEAMVLDARKISSEFGIEVTAATLLIALLEHTHHLAEIQEQVEDIRMFVETMWKMALERRKHED